MEEKHEIKVWDPATGYIVFHEVTDDVNAAWNTLYQLTSLLTWVGQNKAYEPNEDHMPEDVENELRSLCARVGLNLEYIFD